MGQPDKRGGLPHETNRKQAPKKMEPLPAPAPIAPRISTRRSDPGRKDVVFHAGGVTYNATQFEQHFVGNKWGPVKMNKNALSTFMKAHWEGLSDVEKNAFFDDHTSMNPSSILITSIANTVSRIC